ncbi:energy transducer TonB [Rhodanobacter sp. Si-c]|uniref:Energy transducer TonB n=1 Tax=Rhodanobacter lycopersici TaxID=3162487 RepID=A0ABV3QCZ2_9GAMM
MQGLVSLFSRRPVWLGGLLALILAAGGGWWHWNARADTGPSDGNGVRILLGLAGDALHDGRRVAPVGSNAFEFYFSVLQLDPHNRTALDGLREAFKPACEDVERTIAAGDLDEAQRELQLLRAYDVGNYKYDPAHYELNANNYKLALLGGYLDAQRTMLGRRHAEEAAAISARQADAAASQ